ncbi:MAG: preprotein translocase subunit SecG [Oxalobacter formigenes]|nr:preprotein translocase subunit SecG [Oxalobacter formigenes]
MMLFKIIIAVQVLSALAIIGLVLMQHGKGADMGAAFGAGASGSLFGATGSSNFLSRSTAVAAVIFFLATLAMAYLGHRPAPKATVTDQLETMTVAPAQVQQQEKPAAAGMAAVPGAVGSVPDDAGKK